LPAGFGVPEDLVFPGDIGIAVEDHQVAVRGAAGVHVGAGLIQAPGDGVFQPFVQHFEFHHHLLYRPLPPGPVRPARPHSSDPPNATTHLHFYPIWDILLLI
jgi:hypothetical protein